MAYDIAARDKPINSSTGPRVGPTTYLICSSLMNDRKNVTPFLQSSIREPSFIGSLLTEAIYDVRGDLTASGIIGGSTPRNRAPRFVAKVEEETPGPTTYDPKRPTYIKLKKDYRCDMNKPKLFACRMEYSLAASTPSVPTKIDQNGYDFDERGFLIKIPVVPSKPEPFRFVLKPLGDQLGYKGCKWSQRTSKRFDSKVDSENPGPAAYYASVPKCHRVQEEEEFREMARRFSFVPRYIEGAEIRAGKENLPGPQTYDIKLNTIGFENKRSKSIKPKPFVSGARRFGMSISDTPAPDKYKICDCYRTQKKFSRKCTCFGFEALRFPRKKQAETPGPASYMLKSPMMEKLHRKKNQYAVSHPPFNNTALRKMGFIKEDAAFTPSPAEYPEDKVQEEMDTSMKMNSSVFMSVVERFPFRCEKDPVGPASYNGMEAFVRNIKQCDHNVKHPPFNTRGLRGNLYNVHAEMPGPADHEIAELPWDRGTCFKVSPRFKFDRKCTPGPGAYEIHPAAEESIFKARTTHNSRLWDNSLKNNPELLKLPATRPRLTQISKYKKVQRKTKKLQCYYSGPDLYKQMIKMMKKIMLGDAESDSLAALDHKK